MHCGWAEEENAFDPKLSQLFDFPPILKASRPTAKEVCVESD